MSGRTLVFLDTETTGLHRARRPWEVAIIRRSGDEQTKLYLCVDVVDLDLVSTEMLARQGYRPRWRRDLIDVVPLAVVAVRALGLDPEPDYGDLSRQCGVKPPGFEQRHTALGDARWAMRWYDALVQTGSVSATTASTPDT